MLKVIELFSGIGAPRKALQRLGVPHEVVGISEIDKYAVRSYEAIHGETRNYGDISKLEKLDYADLWIYGFPCTDISLSGPLHGIREGTRSGLLLEVERLLNRAKEDNKLPKYLLMENVKNLVGKQFKSDFDRWLSELDKLGYNTYWKVLNAQDFGIPQRRSRVFAVSIRKDIDEGKFEFQTPPPKNVLLKDFLEKDVDNLWYFRPDLQQRFEERVLPKIADSLTETTGCIIEKCAYEVIGTTDVCCTLMQNDYKGYRNQRRTAVFDVKYDADGNKKVRIRKMTPREHFRLMGFSDEDHAKAAAVCSNTQLFRQIGNSIVVQCLEWVFISLFTAQRELNVESN